MRRFRVAMAVLACGVVLSGAAQAQRRGQREEEDKLPPSVAPALSTLPPVRGISGPRLESGAILCGSEADLRHRQDVNRRRVEGVPDAGDPLFGCRILRQERGVEVVTRQGLGAVQVKLKPTGETGWTDAYVR